MKCCFCFISVGVYVFLVRMSLLVEKDLVEFLLLNIVLVLLIFSVLVNWL